MKTKQDCFNELYDNILMSKDVSSSVACEMADEAMFNLYGFTSDFGEEGCLEHNNLWCDECQ